MSILSSLNVSVSGMTAQRYRVNTITENIANAQTTRTPQGGPYRRKEVVLAAVANDRTFEQELLAQDRSVDTSTEVKVVGVSQDERAPVLKYDPGHPDANEEGYVEMPNINVMEEMVNLATASRSYEANITAFNASKRMFLSALEISKG
ncbi:MAG: flagellar basal body rod protein FlgC [SAR324 cluster bacterium]|nr:flagellar basal body rod protein FlgC [SAR324 cluster bacterium]MBF0349831.1 flagellar basal body rod protein FlgC [SAR324 cluster bacterium]